MKKEKRLTQKEQITQKYEALDKGITEKVEEQDQQRKHRSALRALNNLKDISDFSKDFFMMTRSRLLILLDWFRIFTGFNQNNPHDVVV